MATPWNGTAECRKGWTGGDVHVTGGHEAGAEASQEAGSPVESACGFSRSRAAASQTQRHPTGSRTRPSNSLQGPPQRARRCTRSHRCNRPELTIARCCHHTEDALRLVPLVTWIQLMTFPSTSITSALRPAPPTDVIGPALIPLLAKSATS